MRWKFRPRNFVFSYRPRLCASDRVPFSVHIFIVTSLQSVGCILLSMEAHARSLLQRLNTSASPNPTKSPTPEAKPIATPISADSKTSETGPQITVISSPMQRPTQATLEGPDAIMSLKNLLVSARQRSRESSITQIPPSGEESHPTGSSSSETATQRPDSRLGPTSPNHTRHAVVNASDGETSANPEEMPSTPSGSKTSSLVSNGMEHLQETSHQARPPYGLRITNDVPSIVTLPFMKPHIPRLQIKTDDEGHTFPGDGIGHIANLSRTFDLYDRDIIGATTNYIVYALKGLSFPSRTNCRWACPDYRSKFRHQSYCSDPIVFSCHQSYNPGWIRL